MSEERKLSPSIKLDLDVGSIETGGSNVGAQFNQEKSSASTVINNYYNIMGQPASMPLPNLGPTLRFEYWS